MTVRCRHERGDIGPSDSSPGLTVPPVEGISIASGLSVLVVEVVDAILKVYRGKEGNNCPAVVLVNCGNPPKDAMDKESKLL